MMLRCASCLETCDLDDLDTAGNVKPHAVRYGVWSIPKANGARYECPGSGKPPLREVPEKTQHMVLQAVEWPRKRESACMWTRDEDLDAWDTACGEKWTIPNGTPSENEMRFCPCCGRCLIETPQPPPAEAQP